MGKHKGFHRALYRLVLDELKWLWLLAELPGAHWRQFQAVVVDFSDWNVLLMSSTHDIMFHNLAVIFLWLEEWRTAGKQLGHPYWGSFLALIHIGGRQRRFWRMTCHKGHSPDSQTHSIISTWLTPCSAEPARCPAEVKCSLVSFSAPLYCDFLVSWSELAVFAHGVAIRGVGLGLGKPRSKHILCTQL